MRRALLLLAVAGIVGLSFGTSGLSATAIQRDLHGRVADDPHAYLGVEPVGFDRCGQQDLLVLRNQYDPDVGVVHLQVHVVDPVGVTVESLDAPTELDPGESGVVSGDLNATADDASERSVTVRIDARSEAVYTHLNRTYPVECDGTDDG